jgi:hypothetical protein
MKQLLVTMLVTVGVTVATSLSVPAAGQVVEFGNLLLGEEADVLGRVTGFHSVRHEKARLEVRVLEADGSASVAWDPVALYVVVTNNGTSDGEERVWRLPRGVAAVRALSATACGASLRVFVDKIDDGGLVTGRSARTLRMCFLSADGKMQPSLRMTESSK